MFTCVAGHGVADADVAMCMQYACCFVQCCWDNVSFSGCWFSTIALIAITNMGSLTDSAGLFPSMLATEWLWNRRICSLGQW